jgi:hypothetical protein
MCDANYKSTHLDAMICNKLHSLTAFRLAGFQAIVSNKISQPGIMTRYAVLHLWRFSH